MGDRGGDGGLVEYCAGDGVVAAEEQLVVRSSKFDVERSKFNVIGRTSNVQLRTSNVEVKAFIAVGQFGGRPAVSRVAVNREQPIRSSRNGAPRPVEVDWTLYRPTIARETEAIRSVEPDGT